MKSEAKTWYSIDFETSSTNKHHCKIAGLGVCEFDIETGKIKDLVYPHELHYSALTLNGSLVAHNATFDLSLWNRYCPRNIKVDIHDTYLMAKHVNNLLPFFDLKSLAWHFFGEPYLELLELKKWFRSQGLSDDETYMDLTLPPVDLVKAYCLKDVEMTAKLAHLFWKELKDNYAYDLDRRTILHTVETEAWGMAADLVYYQEYRRKGSRRAKYNRKKAAEHMETDKNPMGNALRDHLTSLGETRKTPTKRTQANAAVLRDWRKKDRAIGSVARVRDTEHNISHFVNHILTASVPLSNKIGIFHPNFLQSGAVTRRYRCAGFYGSDGTKTKGNSQNFPDEMREGIIARPGYEFWLADLSSIEARMFSSFMEQLMGESTFAEMYRKDPYFNPYLWVIEQCTGKGKVTKKHRLYVPYKHGVLGRLYCSGPAKFASVLRDKFNLLEFSEDDCRAIYSSIDSHCPFIKRFQRFLLNIAENQGYLLDPFGDIYYLPSQKPYEIIAHLHQGAAANVFKFWLEEVHKKIVRFKADDHVANFLHDELDFEIKKGNKPATRVKGYCKAVEGLDIFGLPLRAEATKGKNWREASI